MSDIGLSWSTCSLLVYFNSNTNNSKSGYFKVILKYQLKYILTFNPRLFIRSITQTKLFGPFDFALSKFLCICLFYNFFFFFFCSVIVRMMFCLWCRPVFNIVLCPPGLIGCIGKACIVIVAFPGYPQFCIIKFPVMLAMSTSKHDRLNCTLIQALRYMKTQSSLHYIIARIHLNTSAFGFIALACIVSAHVFLLKLRKYLA